MNKSIILSLFLAIATTTAWANAEEPKPKKIENAEYLSITYIDFKPGKVGKALKIIREHFIPASRKSGALLPEVVMLHSGEFDMILIGELDNGYSELEWQPSEDSLKWWKAFVELEGEENAKKIRDDYQKLVQRENHEIGYRVTDLK